MAEFKAGDVVEFKHGTGVISYYENGYMDISLDRDRSERSYFAPFEGKVWHWVKPVPINERPEWHEIVVYASDPLEKTHSIYEQSCSIVTILGGYVAPWEELTPFQKMNYLCLHTGFLTEDWLTAFTKGKLKELSNSALEAYRTSPPSFSFLK